MEGREFRSNVPWLIWQLFFSAKPELYRLAETYDLTILQMFAVCLLDPGDELPMNSLSGMLHCDASNVTGIVDKLVSVSLVLRQESTRDRRIKIIQLTPDGQGLRQELLDKIAQMRLPRLDALTSDEKATLERLLQKLIDAQD